LRLSNPTHDSPLMFWPRKTRSFPYFAKNDP
jgi:hypothetical protein